MKAWQINQAKYSERDIVHMLEIKGLMMSLSRIKFSLSQKLPFQIQLPLMNQLSSF